MKEFELQIHRDKSLTFKVPYDPTFINKLHNVVPVKHREFDKTDKEWMIHHGGYLEKVVSLIESHFGEEVVLL